MNHHGLHPSNMSDPQRHHSPTESFKSALSTLKRATTNNSNKSNLSYTPGDDNTYHIPPSPLPDNPRDLEGFLNRHLSALGHLQRTVDERNQELKDYNVRAAYYYNLKPRVSTQFLLQLDTEINVLRAQRNGLRPLVQMRHEEIVRIADHRKMLDEEQGLECTVYDMYLNFRKLEDWEQRFSI